MALTQEYKSKATEVGGVLHPNGCIDAEALSDAAGAKRVHIPVANFTQNTTQRAYAGPLGFRAKLVAAYVSYETVPAGGTLTAQAVVYDDSGSAEVVLASGDAEAATASKGYALTLQAANDAFVVEPTDTIRSLSVANNATVTQQQASGVLTLVFIPMEPVAGALVTQR